MFKPRASRLRESEGKDLRALTERHRAAEPAETLAGERAVVERLAGLTSALDDPWAAATVLFGGSPREADPAPPPRVRARPRRRLVRARPGAMSTE
ncbi:hypothetical protein [Actinomadura sp. DC4]|uniref:hypothetical protein n=1 Tax=Actinomadura sp. DC4 TaxID=3055069 RepID=UPI0025B079FE|nr:hypothetical protein [Actinomadura sp. DC4]MDN3357997.1 hypothetical protein [Actinomadura sp. DC4]